MNAMSAAAQAVDIVPDGALLRAPFSSQDEERFRQPDKVFYPETWFHFIGGNVSKEGIDADLQAIHDAGLSGIQWFHGYFGGPWPATGHQLTTLSPEWEDMVGYLGHKADSLGLRLTVQTCPGWSMAGGPWITPARMFRPEPSGGAGSPRGSLRKRTGGTIRTSLSWPFPRRSATPESLSSLQ